jgi:hypothetical protein
MRPPPSSVQDQVRALSRFKGDVKGFTEGGMAVRTDNKGKNILVDLSSHAAILIIAYQERQRTRRPIREVSQ